MRLLWWQHYQEEDRGVLLVDSCNGFNEENHMTMLWAVWFEWPSGMRFTFNCYCKIVHPGDLRRGRDGSLPPHKGGCDPGVNPGHDILCHHNPPPPIR